MTTHLLFDDSVRSYELRHEVGEIVGDPIAFIELEDGRRIVLGSTLDEPIFTKREDVVDEFWSYSDLGIDELDRDPGVPTLHLRSEMLVRALAKLGVKDVCVPPSFQLATADYLRGKGIEVTVDDEVWMDRRRRKTPWELEGIERAQRAAETAMLAAARMLREAERTNKGQLRFEGEILTSELIRIAMSAELLTQGCESDTILVQSGDSCLKAHDPGSGPVLPDTSLIIDVFPRDLRTGAYSDMTRTFVVGNPSERLAQLHSDCKKALEIAFETIRPGDDTAFKTVAGFFEERGYPTKLSHTGPGVLQEGFSHSLGHGVGLAVHERPALGRRSDPLVEGDVVAIEPGLYFAGVGGVRLEDTVIVTENGVEHFTDPFSYDLVP